MMNLFELIGSRLERGPSSPASEPGWSPRKFRAVPRVPVFATQFLAWTTTVRQHVGRHRALCRAAGDDISNVGSMSMAACPAARGGDVHRLRKPDLAPISISMRIVARVVDHINAVYPR